MKNKTIDEKLLAFFQKTSDWFQEWFGIDNFDIARFLFCFSGFSVISADTYLFYLHKLNGIDIVLTLALLFLMVRNVSDNEQARRSVRNNPVCTNPNVLELYFSRMCTAPLAFVAMVFLPVLPFVHGKTFQITLYAVYLSLYFISDAMGYYFASCTPKPPSHTKKKWKELKERVNSVGRKHSAVIVGN